MSDQTLSTLSIPTIPRQPHPHRRWLRLIAPALAVSLVLLWQLVVPADGPTSLLLPRPSQIVDRFFQVLVNGSLPQNLLITAAEIGLGFLFGVGLAFAAGYSIAKSHTLEQVIGPYLVGFQALPIVAIAPALILWMGPGLTSNSLIAAFIIFFPMLMSTVVGIRSIRSEDLEQMESMAATRWQTFRKLELPGALPVLFGGLKISVILAVAGAVVAESVTPLGGLGSLLYAARSRYDSPLAFVSVFTLSAFALALYGLVVWLERRFLAWKQR